MIRRKPKLDKRIKGHRGYGLIQLFTGDGKGKTTAALGQVMRSVGAGRRVAVLFFDKGGENYTERKVLDKLEVDWWSFGRDRIDPQTRQFDFEVTEDDKEEMHHGLRQARELFKNDEYDLVVLDEINVVTDLGMVEAEHVLEVLDHKPERTEVILTGRRAPDEFIERAHLVTEDKLRKHYFYSAVPARKGLDY